MTKTKESRLFTLLFAFILATTAFANNSPDNNKLERPQAIEVEQIAPDAIQPHAEPLDPNGSPDAVATSSNAELAMPPPTIKPNIEAPHTNKTDTLKPIATNYTDALTDLPASKRLLISAFAGILTLIAALWIGARRD